MTENEKVKKWFKLELSMREEESLDAIECEDMMDICVKALEEIQQYRAIGTLEELKSLKENGAFTGVELAQLNNNGWIPCSERLPEEKENPITHDYMQYPVMVNIGGTGDLRYYYYGNGHWRLGFQIMDKYVTHWMDITPYQPKGE